MSGENKIIAWSLKEGVDISIFTDQKKIESIEFDRSENLLEFLERWSSSPHSIIIYEGLTRYVTEVNYRLVLSRIISGSFAAFGLIIERRNNPKVSIIYRAARALGIEKMMKTSIINNYIVIELKRNLSQEDLLDWRRDPAPFLIRNSSESVIQEIIKSIRNKTRLSLVRIGHCEVRFLGQGIYYGESDLNDSCQIQWGARPADCFVKKIKEDLSESIQGADILGFKDRVSIGSQSLKILDNSILSLLSNLGLFRVGQIQCSPNIHFALGINKEFIDLLKSASEIIIVSPRRAVYEKLKLINENGGKVNWIEIPGEARIDGPYDIETRFNKFIEVQHLLTQYCSLGAIVLVGAGVAGKIYCEVAKNAGAIALDLGSTLDAWAEVDSRGNGFNYELKKALDL